MLEVNNSIEAVKNGIINYNCSQTMLESLRVGIDNEAKIIRDDGMNLEGCGYIAAANCIFREYEGREEEFEKDINPSESEIYAFETIDIKN